MSHLSVFRRNFRYILGNISKDVGPLIDIYKRINAKQYLEAHTECMELIRQNVQNPMPFHALGLIAFDHENFVKATELFERATQLDGSKALYWASYAQILSVIGRQDDARRAAEKGADLPLEDPLTADIIGVVFSRAGFHERAIPFFRRALELNPNSANFHYNLASSLQFDGQFFEAKKSYQDTLDRDANFFKAYSGLVTLDKQSSDNNRLEALEALFEKNQNDADASLNLGHAIAKTYEDIGEYETSFDWLARAKKINKERYPIDPIEQEALFEAAKKTVGDQQAPSAEADQSAPIFVVGLPRTGTTLVDRILSSHPDVTAAGELNVFAGLVKAASGTRNNLILDAATLDAAGRADFSSVGKRYLEGTKALARGGPRFTDKMPLNFFYAGLILKAMPNARIVALRRGAMDSCLSNYRQLFSTQFSYYNYTFDLENTAEFYRGFDDLMAHWRTVLPADRFTEICYEDIVHDQENQTRRLLEFCDLSWNEACLRFHENDAPVSTASSVQVRQPLYSGSIGRWKRYGDRIDNLKAALGDLAK
jgi:tetratricopeptide (TPR) repeat protein